MVAGMPCIPSECVHLFNSARSVWAIQHSASTFRLKFFGKEDATRRANAQLIVPLLMGDGTQRQLGNEGGSDTVCDTG